MMDMAEELCPILHRMLGLLMIIKREITERDDGDNDAVLAVIGVLEADLDKAMESALHERDRIKEAA
jgi:hypothetical protein